MSEWREVDSSVEAITVTMTVVCDHCAHPVPINRPTRQVHCLNCQKTTHVSTLHEELHRLCKAYDFPRNACSGKALKAPGPDCAKCGKHIAIASWLGKVGARTKLPCPACNAPVPTYPAPDWLRAELPGALQVFGGEPEPEEHGAQSALELEGAQSALELEQDAPKPIAMACPQCAGGLLIQASDDRVVECRYCKTGVFLPDELWRRLHPAKTMRAWTLTYAGGLSTAAEVAQRTREREREVKDYERAERAKAAREAKRLAEQRAQEEQAEALRLAHAQSQRRMRGWLLAMLLLTALVVGITLLLR